MNGVMARRSVWADPELQKLAGAFLPVADEVGLLQNAGTAESRFFRIAGDRGHAGVEHANKRRQGIYAIAPSGRLLASVNSTRPSEVAAMMRRALAIWQLLPEQQRRMGAGWKRVLGLVPRWHLLYPDDGLILQVYSRDLPAAEDVEGERRYGWNRDHAWFTRDEAEAFVPEPATVGARRKVPAAVVRRLARCHLVDQVRGQTWPVPPGGIEKAELTAETVRTEGDLVELRLTGATRAVQVGTWSIDNQRDEPSLHEHGVETELSGTATWDREASRFRTFELIAVGTRWGGTTYNRRADQLGPSPIAFVLRLAPEGSDHRVAPSLLGAYGWVPGPARTRRR